MEKSPCDDKTPCCKGYACYDGYCKPAKKPEPPKEEPADDDTTYVDTLPSTGTGPDAGDAGSVGALLAGGAAAAMAVWLQKSDSEPVSEVVEES